MCSSLLINFLTLKILVKRSRSDARPCISSQLSHFCGVRGRADIASVPALEWMGAGLCEEVGWRVSASRGGAGGWGGSCSWGGGGVLLREIVVVVVVSC